MYGKIAVVCCLAVVFYTSPLEAQRPKECSVIKSGYRFSFTLYRDLIGKAPTENLIFSPYSISTATAMVMLGTQGETEKELKGFLQYGDCDTKSRRIHSSQKQIRELIQTPRSELTLTTANKLYPENHYLLNATYTAEAQWYYGTTVEKMDFRSKPDISRVRINDWVAEQTDGIIQDLLPMGTVNSLTQMVLVNAIYFKGTWEKQFDPRITRDFDFHVNENTVKKAPFMIQKGKFKYATNGLFSILELPYKGDVASMIIVLPEARHGLSGIERILDGEFLRALTHYGKTRQVNVHIPKFKMESSKALVNSYNALGVKTLFTPAADFSGMSDTPGMFISDIRHKAFIEVNEVGTEAAAATAAGGKRHLGLGVTSFMCDHPFLYYIIHKPTKAILFLGRYVTPTD